MRGFSLLPTPHHRSPELRSGMTTRSRRWTQRRSANAGCAPRRRSSSTEPRPPTTGWRSRSSPTWRSRSRAPIPRTSSSPASATPPGRSGCTTNFFSPENVPELGNARSYAARLFDYEGSGRDQLAWVVERLRADPASRSATITTFEPLLDTTYIPCVSMLDFWAPAGRLELVVYAHSLDFGKKAYGNLVELARLQELVAGELGLPLGPLDDLRQVGARLRARVGPDGAARRELARLAAQPGEA